MEVFGGTGDFSAPIPRRGVVGWSRASRNLLVPDHGERMSGRNESDSRIWGGLVSVASRREIPMRAFVQSHNKEPTRRVSQVAAVN